MHIQIIDCSDPMFWYAGLVGEELPLAGESEDVYWSYEIMPPHCKNVILKKDAILVDDC